jgi:ribosomal protein S19
MGEETATCKRCNYTKTRDVERAPHTEVTVKAVAPTCTKSGKTEGKKCSVCDKVTVEPETVEKLGHSLGEYKVTKKPTCKAMGEETVTCKRCDYTKTRDVERAPHTEVTVKAVAPTCTKSGKTEGKKCSVCDKVTVEPEIVEKLGHEFGEYQVTKEATCSAEGEKTAACIRCSYSKTADIEKLEHKEVSVKAVKATCTKTGKTSGKKCSLCGKITVAQKTTEALGHSKKITVVTKATNKANGKISTVCETCGKDYGQTRVYRIKTVELSSVKYAYDGKTKSPKVKITDYNKDQLIKDEDYTVTYQKGRKLPGKYSVKVKFKGRYSGEVTLYFEIKLSKVDKLTASAGTTAVTLKWKEVKGADGYQIYYSTSKDGKYKKLKSTSKLSFKKTGLKSGKTYYFKVRAYKKLDSGTVFGSFSSVKSAKIK